MKNLSIVLLLIISSCVYSSAQSFSKNPVDHGHEITENVCDCAKKFKNTRKWTMTKRGSFYCMATTQSGKNKGKKYKRYFSSYIAYQKRKANKGKYNKGLINKTRGGQDTIYNKATGQKL